MLNVPSAHIRHVAVVSLLCACLSVDMVDALHALDVAGIDVHPLSNTLPLF